MRIEDYGLIGDLQTAALVGLDGSIDWLCLPRFDSASCFSALLGEPAHGRWLWRRQAEARSRSRRYRPGTLVLETDVETADGSVRVIDFIPRRRDGPPQVVRIVEGISGAVPMRSQLVLRPDYGAIVPWIEPVPDGALSPPGRTPSTSARRTRSPWPTAHRGRLPRRRRLADAIRHELAQLIGAQPAGRERRLRAGRTEAWWSDWSGRCIYDGAYSDAVRTSLVVLKAMTHGSRAPWWRRRPRRCPRTSAGSATGTTATAGCATRCSPSRRC